MQRQPNFLLYRQPGELFGSLSQQNNNNNNNNNNSNNNNSNNNNNNNSKFQGWYI